MGFLGIKFSELAGKRLYEFQKDLLRTLLQIEEVYFNQAALITDKNVLVISDRGAMDPSAYIDKEGWANICAELGHDDTSLRDNRYDQIVHMVTCAEGAEDFYTVANNNTREEGMAGAKRIDWMTRHAWVGHPSISIIDNSECKTFDDKIRKLLQVVCDRAGVQTYERLAKNTRKRKWLLAGYKQDEFPKYKEFQHKHDFLMCGEDGIQMRIRAREQKGKLSYTITSRYPPITEAYPLETRMKINKPEYDHYRNLSGCPPWLGGAAMDQGARHHVEFYIKIWRGSSLTGSSTSCFAQKMRFAPTTRPKNPETFFPDYQLAAQRLAAARLACDNIKETQIMEETLAMVLYMKLHSLSAHEEAAIRRLWETLSPATLTQRPAAVFTVINMPFVDEPAMMDTRFERALVHAREAAAALDTKAAIQTSLNRYIRERRLGLMTAVQEAKAELAAAEDYFEKMGTEADASRLDYEKFMDELLAGCKRVTHTNENELRAVMPPLPEIPDYKAINWAEPVPVRAARADEDDTETALVRSPAVQPENDEEPEIRPQLAPARKSVMGRPKTRTTGDCPWCQKENVKMTAALGVSICLPCAEKFRKAVVESKADPDCHGCDASSPCAPCVLHQGIVLGLDPARYRPRQRRAGEDQPA